MKIILFRKVFVAKLV